MDFLLCMRNVASECEETKYTLQTENLETYLTVHLTMLTGTHFVVPLRTFYVKIHSELLRYILPLANLLTYLNTAFQPHIEVILTHHWQIMQKQVRHCFLSDCVLHYSKTCLEGPLKKKIKNGFQDRLLLNAVQKYCRMLQGDSSSK